MTSKNTVQSGRSMVEMLGTLAIIGVLSVGAIAGYSYGMDKYRANQTVNDVMLRAVDIMTQLSQGKEPNLEPEWGTKGTVYDMEAIKDETNNTWGVVVDGVPSRICKLIGEALKTQATVYVSNTYYSAAEDICDSSEENTMEFYFDVSATSGDQCKIDTDCGTGNYCDNGWCFSGNHPEVTVNIMGGTCASDADCNQGWTGTNCAYCDATYGCVEDFSSHNKSCTLTDGNVAGKCGGGQCNPSGCTYDTNKCGDKEYCASPNNSCTEAFQSGETGMCVPINTTFSKIPGTEYYVSNGPLSWWDAYAACKSIKKELLSVSDLVTETDGSAWEGDEGFHTKTALANELYSKGWNSTGYPYIWTKNLPNDSCYAYYVSPGGSVFSSYSRGSSSFYAVCR